MIIEIITIGDEILTGHTVDSNSAYIAKKLLEVGLEVSFITSIGDSIEQMEETFRQALNRSQIIITTGGLGPTDDDLTKKAIVRVFKRNLIFHEEVLEDIKERYAKRDIKMPAINHNQALLPQGAKFFPNKLGSAVGLCIAENGKTFISLPGVPQEMKQLIDDEILPYLQNLSDTKNISVLKLRTVGIVESKLAELIKPDLKLENNVRLAYLPSYSGVDLRIISKGDTEDEALTKLRTLQSHLESAAGKYIYGYNSDTLEENIGQLLKDNDKTLAVAESCTGGLLGSLLTSVPGSSHWFKGGIISYANEIKESALAVPHTLLEQYGAVSEECAAAMAKGVKEKFDSEYAIAITGIAGPDGGTDEKPVGLTYVGIAYRNDVVVRMFNFGKDRISNRTRACYGALEMLRRDILDIT
ncbi:MAG: competence/damage-inducible protein A [Calditrichaeota bacterium]|nr:MAG: competence/damage-inducible protein A [Calditrichota bacterium]